MVEMRFRESRKNIDYLIKLYLVAMAICGKQEAAQRASHNPLQTLDGADYYYSSCRKPFLLHARK